MSRRKIDRVMAWVCILTPVILMLTSELMVIRKTIQLFGSMGKTVLALVLFYATIILVVIVGGKVLSDTGDHPVTVKLT